MVNTEAVPFVVNHVDEVNLRNLSADIVGEPSSSPLTKVKLGL